MSAQTIYANPFLTLAELLRGLEARFTAQARQAQGRNLLHPPACELLGAIVVLVQACENLARQVEELQTRDPQAFEAFQRALEKP